MRIYHCLSETQASCLIDYFHLLQIKLWRVSLINSASVNNIVSTVLHTLPPYFHCSTVGLMMSILMFWFMHSIFINTSPNINSVEFCVSCCMGKSHKLPSLPSPSTYFEPLELHFCDFRDIPCAVLYGLYLLCVSLYFK